MSWDEHWLTGKRLKTIKARGVDVARWHLALLQEFCGLTGADQERAVRRFIECVLRDVDRRRIANAQATEGYGGPWPHVIELFSALPSHTLSRRLLADQDALCGRKTNRVSPATALARLLHSYFSDSVGELRSPDAPTRARAWSSLWPMCETCAEELDVERWAPQKRVGWVISDPFLRCLEGKVRAALAAGKDRKNLPQPKNPKLMRDRLLTYLEEFHPALQFVQEPDAAPEIGDPIAPIAEEHTSLQFWLERTCRALPEPQRACVEHWVREESETTETTQAEFCAQQGISPEEYAEHVAASRDNLGAALREYLSRS